MNKKQLTVLASAFLVLVLAGFALSWIPAIRSRLDWRIDLAMTSIRRRIQPVGELPTPIASGLPLPPPRVTTISQDPTPTEQKPPADTEIPLPTATSAPTLAPTPTPLPLPQKAVLTPPEIRPGDAQDWNNCGPATLALNLRYYGWGGNQYTVSDVIKPIRADRNVNVEDLVYYVNTQASPLRSIFRVGGSREQIKRLLANGFPVMLEVGFVLPADAQGVTGPSDDRWTGHFLFVAGYDDSQNRFIVQDVYEGGNHVVAYPDVEERWQAFNRVYIIVYKPEQESTLQSLLADDWDARANRQNALNAANAETIANPQNSFAWFNLGTNLVYFERYTEAADAYNRARQIGLPQRMLRYQFGPFLAYFHAGFVEELDVIADYALKITPNSEEALLWKGWAQYRMGLKEEALKSFYKALEARPGYEDASYAIRYVYEN